MFGETAVEARCGRAALAHTPSLRPDRYPSLPARTHARTEGSETPLNWQSCWVCSQEKREWRSCCRSASSADYGPAALAACDLGPVIVRHVHIVMVGYTTYVRTYLRTARNGMQVLLDWTGLGSSLSSSGALFACSVSIRARDG